jgi:hypothetical protein
MEQFISEDNLKTLEGWLEYQRLEESEETRRLFAEARARSAAFPQD